MARFQTMGKRTFSGRKPYVLFLCTGNTCRSAIAQGVLRRMLDEAGITDIEIRTAGVMTIPGLMPTQECRHLLLKEGIDISYHRSHQLTPDLIKLAELVLGMTSFHVQMALRMSEHAKGKTFLFKEFTGSDPKNGQIQDPMGCTLEVYKKVYREIKAACKRLIKKRLLQDFLAGSAPRSAGKGAKSGPKTASVEKKAPGKKKPRGVPPVSQVKKTGAKPLPAPKPSVRKPAAPAKPSRAQAAASASKPSVQKPGAAKKAAGKTEKKKTEKKKDRPAKSGPKASAKKRGAQIVRKAASKKPPPARAGKTSAAKKSPQKQTPSKKGTTGRKAGVVSRARTASAAGKGLRKK